LDNGTGRDQKLPLEQQADLVKRAGYAGIGYTGTQRIPELLGALDARGLQLFSIYVGSRVDGAGPAYDPGLPEAIRQLKGRKTVVWLNIQGKAPDGDERAAAIVREVADLAAGSGLRVVIYPHVGFCVERVEDALRIRALAGRPNVGVTFNLAHFLAIGDEPNLDKRLTEAMPFLEMVTVNGADHEGDWRKGDWSRLIQTLDRGAFDVRGLVQKLRRLGYRGPIGLQCYQVAGDIEENLKRSMAAWRTMVPGQ
jgi:sugar phosphate isomerase/epimerase